MRYLFIFLLFGTSVIASDLNDTRLADLESMIALGVSRLDKSHDQHETIYLSTSWSAYPGVHNELIAELNKMIPNELAEALNSSGNMHNPTMAPIRQYFSEALAKTSLVKALECDGWRFIDATFEKLTLSCETGKPMFDCLLHLNFVPGSE